MKRNEKNNYKKWPIFVVALLLSMAIFTPITQSLPALIRNNEQPKLIGSSDEDFSITIHRIKEEDEIDPWPHGDPDWQLRMYVNGNKKTYECVGENVIVDKTFLWSGVIHEGDEYVNIKMELLDLDSWPDTSDIADISAYIDWDYEEGDYDNTVDFGAHRPAVFKRTYNLLLNEWEPVDDDNDFLNVEYDPPRTWYITSGNYDGSTNTDENDASVWFNISVGNTPPYPPEKPDGPTVGWQGMIYDYSTKGHDIDGDRIQFAWDWQGDGEIDELTGFFDSWETCISPHVWTQGSLNYVKVKAIDERGLQGEWSDYLKVRINAPGGINGVEEEEWSLGRIISYYFNHQKTQEIIQILRTGGNVVTALTTLITAIATAFGIPIPYAVVFTIVSAIIRLGVEVINMMDHGMGIYLKVFIIEFNDFPVGFFAYIWSQTPDGKEGKAPEGNEEPFKPEKPSGPRRLIPNKDYIFSTKTTDQDDDKITYVFDWGDGKYSCSDLEPSGDRVYMNHTWEEIGNFQIKVLALDEYGQESEWSEKLEITTPRSKTSFRSLILNFLARIRYNFPVLEQILSVIT